MTNLPFPISLFRDHVVIILDFIDVGAVHRHWLTDRKSIIARVQEATETFYLLPDP